MPTTSDCVVSQVDKVLEEDLGPHGWVYEDGKYRGLEVGTKVVCTNSFYLGHIGIVEAIMEGGKVEYRFPTLSDITRKYEVWESKSKWRFTVVPQNTRMSPKMSEMEIARYCKLHQVSEEETVSTNMEMYESFFPRGELKKREQIAIRVAIENDRRKAEDARRLKENKMGADAETHQEWISRREKEDFLRVLENGRRKTEQKQIAELNERTIHRYERRDVLLFHLKGVYCLVELIFDLEETIQLWSSPLGWVFENGKYKGLRSGSRVVCTAKFLGHVGYVSSIEDDSNGTAKYYFPTYRDGKIEEVYGPTQAINSFGLCIVPDDTDLSNLMSKEEAYGNLKI